jgi:hypothetical protein
MATSALPQALGQPRMAMDAHGAATATDAAAVGAVTSAARTFGWSRACAETGCAVSSPARSARSSTTASRAAATPSTPDPTHRSTSRGSTHQHGRSRRRAGWKRWRSDKERRWPRRRAGLGTAGQRCSSRGGIPARRRRGARLPPVPVGRELVREIRGTGTWLTRGSVGRCWRGRGSGSRPTAKRVSDRRIGSCES